MDVAERQHEIGAAGCGDGIFVARKLRHLDFSEPIGERDEFGVERRIVLLHLRRRGRLIAIGGDVAAAILQIGRENFGPVAAAARQYLDDDAIGLHAKKIERVGGMAVFVARAVGLPPVRACGKRSEVASLLRQRGAGPGEGDEKSD
jgi:hypothetical protein